MLRLLLSVTCCFTIAACTGEKTTPNDGGQPKTDSGQGMAADDHGDRKALGSLTVTGHTFEVIQFGEVVAGGEIPVDLEWPKGKERPSVVRAWIGVESGEGSMKARLSKEGDRVMHNHVEVPKPMPTGSKLWIEIEDGDAKGQASIAYQ